MLWFLPTSCRQNLNLSLLLTATWGRTTHTNNYQRASQGFREGGLTPAPHCVVSEITLCRAASILLNSTSECATSKHIAPILLDL
jgi:hypothetical protein